MSLHPPPHLLDAQRWNNLRVGLLGGSFNPPHEGHVHISRAALSGLNLDVIWWLVTPQNPIKCDLPLELKERMRLCEELIDHPKIIVSDIEKDLNTSITYHSVKKLKAHFPRTEFVWISGMDNALSLHEWNYWRKLLQEICMVHLTRPPAKSLIQSCPLRLYKKQHHIVLSKAGRHPLDSGITYWMMQKKMVDVSSTEIRKKNGLKTAL